MRIVLYHGSSYEGKQFLLEKYIYETHAAPKAFTYMHNTDKVHYKKQQPLPLLVPFHLRCTVKNFSMSTVQAISSKSLVIKEFTL